jgi:hypothetical protein
MNLLAPSRFQSIIAAIFLLMFCASEFSIYTLDTADEIVQLELESEDANDTDETSQVKDQLSDVFFEDHTARGHFRERNVASVSKNPPGETSLGVRETLSEPPELKG